MISPIFILSKLAFNKTPALPAHSLVSCSQSRSQQQAAAVAPNIFVSYVNQPLQWPENDLITATGKPACRPHSLSVDANEHFFTYICSLGDAKVTHNPPERLRLVLSTLTQRLAHALCG